MRHFGFHILHFRKAYVSRAKDLFIIGEGTFFQLHLLMLC